jgi:ribosome biogenesis GTPase
MININEYGYDAFYEKQISTEEKMNEFLPARVISVQKETYRVISSEGENNAKLKGSIFYQNSMYQTYPAVGDFVLIKSNKQGDDIIYRVLERRSSFSRVNPSLRTQVSGASEQIVAANFDYVFIMQSLNYDFNVRRTERYLASAWQSGGTPVIILTKADLCSDYEDKVSELSLAAPGVDIHVISAHTGFGMENLEKYFTLGRTLVLWVLQVLANHLL